MSKPFKRIYIEITNCCNLACTFCPGTSRPIAFMTPERFEILVGNVSGYAKHVYFHVLGEPLLHPDLGVFLDIAHRHSLFVNITTNGTLISKVADLLSMKPAVRQITISMHSFGHNAISQTVQKYVNPVLDFSKTVRPEQFVSLRLWNTKEKKLTEDMALTFDLIEKKFELGYGLFDKLQSTNSITLAKNVFLNIKEPFDWPDANAPLQGETGFCLGLRSQIAILVDGSVVPCCLDRNGDMVLGNIFETPMEKIIAGDRAQKIVNGFSMRKVVESLCKKCTYRTRFSL